MSAKIIVAVIVGIVVASAMASYLGYERGQKDFPKQIAECIQERNRLENELNFARQEIRKRDFEHRQWNALMEFAKQHDKAEVLYLKDIPGIQIEGIYIRPQTRLGVGTVFMRNPR